MTESLLRDLYRWILNKVQVEETVPVHVRVDETVYAFEVTDATLTAPDMDFEDGTINVEADSVKEYVPVEDFQKYE